MTRTAAVAAPALMLGYGILRWTDGRDGDRGNGWEWDVGHVAFLLAMLLFGVLVGGLARRAPGPRELMAAAEVVAYAGVACFAWVIAGDLSPAFDNAPGLVLVAGPVLFQAGALTVLIRLAFARAVPVWTPLLVLAGFGAIGVNLDLLPLGAVLIGVGLAPVGLRPVPVARPARPGVDRGGPAVSQSAHVVSQAADRPGRRGAAAAGRTGPRSRRRDVP